MAHYAQLNEHNIVTEIITGKDEPTVDEGILIVGAELYWENYYTQETGIVHKKTSYNTKGGVHLNGKTPFRKNFAGIGYYYDEIRDAFIPPKPFNSWILNEDTCLWEPPFNPPEDNNIYKWNESMQQWIKL